MHIQFVSRYVILCRNKDAFWSIITFKHHASEDYNYMGDAGWLYFVKQSKASNGCNCYCSTEHGDLNAKLLWLYINYELFEFLPIGDFFHFDKKSWKSMFLLLAILTLANFKDGARSWRKNKSSYEFMRTDTY